MMHSPEPSDCVGEVRRSAKSAKAQANATTASMSAKRRSVENKGMSPYTRDVSPITGEHEYTAEQVLMIKGVDEFKRRTGRKFLTICEVLWVAERLGWAKADNGGAAPATAVASPLDPRSTSSLFEHRGRGNDRDLVVTRRRVPANPHPLHNSLPPLPCLALGRFPGYLCPGRGATTLPH